MIAGRVIAEYAALADEDPLYSPDDEAAAAIALQSFAKRGSVALGQPDDAASIDSLAINAGLVQANCRSVERGRILGVASLESARRFRLRFLGCQLDKPIGSKSWGCGSIVCLAGEARAPNSSPMARHSGLTGCLPPSGARRLTDAGYGHSLRGLRRTCLLRFCWLRKRFTRGVWSRTGCCRFCIADHDPVGDFARTFHRHIELRSRGPYGPDHADGRARRGSRSEPGRLRRRRLGGQRNRRRLEWFTGSPVETRVAAPRRRTRPRHRSSPLPAGNEQMEQGLSPRRRGSSIACSRSSR